MKKLFVVLSMLFTTMAFAYGPDRLSHLIHDGDYTCNPSYIKARIDGQPITQNIPYNERDKLKARFTITNNRHTAYFEGMGPLEFDGVRDRPNYTEHGWYARVQDAIVGVINIMPWGSNEMFITFYSYKNSRNWLRARLRCRRGRFY
jgi:hypothetical protein